MNDAAPPVSAPRPVTTPQPSASRLAFVVLAPPAAWALQESVCAVVGVSVCAAGHVAAARWIVFAVSIVCLAFAVAAAFLGYSSWRSYAPSEGVIDAEARGARELLAFAGLLLGVVFAIAVFWSGLSSITIGDICGAKR